jgi:hypothetical protein
MERGREFSFGGLEMNPNEFWNGWTQKTGTLSWRLAGTDDLPAIRKLMNATQRLTGEVQRNPRLFSMPTLLTLVAQNEDGKIVDCLYVEAQVEIVRMACNPESMEESSKLEPDLVQWLRSIGIRTVLATTLPGHREKMVAGLEASGFKCLDQIFSLWRRLL